MRRRHRLTGGRQECDAIRTIVAPVFVHRWRSEATLIHCSDPPPPPPHRVIPPRHQKPKPNFLVFCTVHFSMIEPFANDIIVAVFAGRESVDAFAGCSRLRFFFRITEY